MTNQILMRFFGRNQAEAFTNDFLSFATLAEAEDYVLRWFEQRCGVECVGEEERVRREAEGDSLVVTHIPLEGPGDLSKYRGIYSFEEAGSIALDIDMIWDENSALRFRSGAFKEYRLDEIFTDEADEMMETLDQMVHYYQGNPVDLVPMVEKIRQLVIKDGVAEF